MTQALSIEVVGTLDDRFRDAVSDLLDLPELQASRGRVHHFDLSEYDHLIQVALTAHRVSRFLRADARICARAGPLHDLGAHWFNTVAPLELAARLEESTGVCHAIRAHTLVPVLPRTREAWAVVAADFITTARECHLVYRRARAQARARVAAGLGAPLGARLAPQRTTPAFSFHRVRLRPVLRADHGMLRHLTHERRLAMQARFSPFAGLRAGPFVRRSNLAVAARPIAPAASTITATPTSSLGALAVN